MSHHLPNSTPCCMDSRGTVHKPYGISQHVMDKTVRCTLAQGMVFGSGACPKCFPGDPPWKG